MRFVPPAQTTLVANIGAGSTFAVALVRWRGQEVIARRLRPGLEEHPHALRAFVRHRAALERLRHPAVPRLLNEGRDHCGPFALERRMPGVPLRQLAVDHHVARGPLPSLALRRIAAEAFRTLAELHTLGDGEGPLGFVHGDVGPDHLFVTPSPAGGIGFVDYGLARLRGVDGERGARGTLPFVAPEVAQGAEPDAIADVYALAATIAFAALGRDPCREEGAARLVEIADRGVDREAIGAAPLDPVARETLLEALRYPRAERLVDPAQIAVRLEARRARPRSR